MIKKDKISRISIICWSSAILLGLIGILMLSSIYRFGSEYSYLLIVGAVMMFGWAFLLVWADRDHYYRKGVFAITGLVTTGLLFAQMYGYSIGVLPLKIAVATAFFLCMLIVLFALSYLAVKRTGCSKKNIFRQLTLKHLLARIL